MNTGKKKVGKLVKIAVAVIVVFALISMFGESEDQAISSNIEKTEKINGEIVSSLEAENTERTQDISQYSADQNLNSLVGTYSWMLGENEDSRGAEINIYYDDAKELCIYGNSWAGASTGEVGGIVTDIFDNGSIVYVDDNGEGVTIYPTINEGIRVEEYGTFGEAGTTFSGEYQRVIGNNENLVVLDDMGDEEWTDSYEVDEYNPNEYETDIIGDDIGQYMFAVPNYPYENKKKADKLMKTYKKAMKADIDDFVYLEEVKTGFILGEKKIYYKKTINEEKAAYKYYGKLNKKNEPEGTGILLEKWNDYAYEEAFDSRYIVMVYYIGEFKKGVKHGYGIDYKQLAHNKFILEYEGEFKDGKYSGDGIKYFGANSIAEDHIPSDSMAFLYKEFMAHSEVDDLFPYYDGNKLITFPIVLSNKEYEGKFKNGEYHGKGKEFNPNSYNELKKGKDYLYLYYDGDFKKGRYEGKGTLYFSNGDIKYKGEFKNGKYHGKGTLYDEDKKVIHKGKFKYGEID